MASFNNALLLSIKVIGYMSKIKIITEKQIKKNRENFCLAPLFKRAERIAIPKSSLLVDIESGYPLIL